MPPGSLEQFAASLGAHQEPCGVLEVRRHVDELRGPALLFQVRGHPFDRGDLDAFGILRHADQRGLEIVKRGNGAAVGWQLDDHPIARIDQHAAREIETLLRSAGDDDVLEARADAAGVERVRQQVLDERAVPARRAVLQSVAFVARQNLRGDGLEVVPRKHVRRGIAGGERNQAGNRSAERADPPDCGFLEVPGGLRNRHARVTS